MKLIEILIIGTNTSIMETIARLIDKDGLWKATISFSFEDACKTYLTKDFNLVLIGAGVSADEEQQLSILLNKTKPMLPIVKHYGGGSGLLFAEIHGALNKR
jgi:hypothetical protein